MSALGKQINSDDILWEFVTGVLLDTQTIIFFVKIWFVNYSGCLSRLTSWYIFKWSTLLLHMSVLVSGTL